MGLDGLQPQGQVVLRYQTPDAAGLAVLALDHLWSVEQQRREWRTTESEEDMERQPRTQGIRERTSYWLLGVFCFSQDRIGADMKMRTGVCVRSCWWVFTTRQRAQPTQPIYQT